MSNQSYTIGLFVRIVEILVCNLVYGLDHISMTTWFMRNGVIINQIITLSVVMSIKFNYHIL